MEILLQAGLDQETTYNAKEQCFNPAVRVKNRSPCATPKKRPERLLLDHQIIPRIALAQALYIFGTFVATIVSLLFPGGYYEHAPYLHLQAAALRV